jgi:WAS family protein 1
VEDKVLKLTGINKSIKVYCSSKYPAPVRNEYYEYDIKHVEITQPPVKVKYKPLPPEKLSLKEKLKFYHIKDRSTALRKNQDVFPFEGLGGLPEDISSVSSLLLFNTNQNLYKNYKLVDPLSISFKERENVDGKPETTVIEPAPSSIGLNDKTGYKFDRNFFYSPLLQDVPQIEAPLDLPHLPGIAGDLRYSIDHPNIEEKLEERVSSNAELQVEEVPTIVDDLPKLSTSKESSVPIPPPPPPPVAPPPPPPPPPLPLVVDEPSLPQPQQTQRDLSPIQPASDSRADLMAAIRKAGGAVKAKLKSVSETATSSEEPTVKKTGNNLMDDLHAKLQMRRKGISGKVDTGEGMMDRVLSMIPPPPPANKEPEETDEEWDE